MNIGSDVERRLVRDAVESVGGFSAHPMEELTIYGTEDPYEAFAYAVGDPVAHLQMLYLADELTHAEFEAALERVYEAVPTLVETA